VARSGGVSVTQPVTVRSLESAVLVGVTGFEPATLSSRTRCTTGLWVLITLSARANSQRGRRWVRGHVDHQLFARVVLG